MSKIQSIIFNRNNYNTIQSRRWLKKHNYTPIKRVDKTKNFLRYRIKEPNKKYKYRLIDFSPYIKVVLMYI